MAEAVLPLGVKWVMQFDPATGGYMPVVIGVSSVTGTSDGFTELLNGLTLSNSVGYLGGALIQSTEIDGDNQFNFSVVNVPLLHLKSETMRATFSGTGVTPTQLIARDAAGNLTTVPYSILTDAQNGLNLSGTVVQLGGEFTSLPVVIGRAQATNHLGLSFSEDAYTVMLDGVAGDGTRYSLQRLGLALDGAPDDQSLTWGSYLTGALGAEWSNVVSTRVDGVKIHTETFNETGASGTYEHTHRLLLPHVEIKSTDTNLGAAQTYMLVRNAAAVATAEIRLVGDTGKIQLTSANIVMPSLPTSNPGVVGQLWNDSGTLKVSAG
jgi:hypothetical protein